MRGYVPRTALLPVVAVVLVVVVAVVLVVPGPALVIKKLAVRPALTEAADETAWQGCSTVRVSSLLAYGLMMGAPEGDCVIAPNE